MGDKYKKNKGYADAEGVKFQLDLVIVSSLNALLYHENWRISSENKKAGKFDDVVIELSDGTSVLVQAKHKKGDRNSITKEQFLSTKKNADFGLPKYFFSYEEIKDGKKDETVIICTNAPIEEKGLENVLTPHVVDSENVLYYENISCSFFTLNENILSKLKGSLEIYFDSHLQDSNISKTVITDENVKYFLKNLRVFSNYPSAKCLPKIIESLLSRVNITNYNSSWGNNISYHEIYRKVEDWLKHPVGEYLTQTRVKAMLCEIRSDKYCKLLKNYDMSFQCNNFDIKRMKKVIHVTVDQAPHLMQMLKIYHTIQNEKSKILFMNPNDVAVLQKDTIDAFEQRHFSILIMDLVNTARENVANEISDKLRRILERNEYKKIILIADDNNKLVQQIGLGDITRVHATLTLENLSKNSQERLLNNKNIVFQGATISLKELLKSPTTQDYRKVFPSAMLEKLIRGEKVKVGKKLLNLDEDVARYYVCRKFKSTSRGAWDGNVILEENIFDVTEDVVLISDSAGLGKSTVITKIARLIKDKHVDLWVIRINITEYTAVLSERLRKNENTITATELLNSKEATKMTNQLETFIFSMNKKVVLLIDGIDEISPDYTSLILDLLLQCQKASNFSKIFVTTRPHMALELETTLKIESFKLLPFTRMNQVHFLADYWAYNLQLDHASQTKCTQYAEVLIDKMSSWIESYDSWENTFTYIPLQVRMLAEIFQESSMWKQSADWEGCKEYLSGDSVEPKLPEEFNIGRLYDIFLEKKQDVFVVKENPSGNVATNTALLTQFDECLAYHRSLALKMILNKASDLFTSCHPNNNDTKEFILKFGIVQRFGYKFQFIHRTFAEYFVADSIVRELKRQNPNPEFQRFVIEKILGSVEFEVICTFLDNLLQTVTLPPDVLKMYRYLTCDADSSLIIQLARKSHIAILQFVLENLNFITIKRKITSTSQRRVSITLNKRKHTLTDLKVVVRTDEVSIRNEDGEAALHSAVAGCHLDMMHFLGERSAKVNSKCDSGRTALHLVEECVEHGANLNATDTERLTLPDLVAGYHRRDSVKYFMKDSTDVNIKASKGYSALHLALKYDPQTVVEYFVHHVANVNVRNNEGRTALHLAVKYNRLNIVKCLVQRGADINAADCGGHTALHLAVKYNHQHIIEYLVRQDVNVNVKNNEGHTALHLAVKYNHACIVKYLLQHGANVNEQDCEGSTALHLVVIHNHPNVAKYIINNGVNINIKDDEGRTALHLAINRDRLNFAKDLVTHGADLNVRDGEGRTLLHLASASRRLDCVKYLLERGVCINCKDGKGRTALHVAVKYNRLNTVKYLVECGAAVNVMDHEGCSALHLAEEMGKIYIVEYLIKVGVDVNATDNDSYWWRLYAYMFKKRL